MAWFDKWAIMVAAAAIALAVTTAFRGIKWECPNGHTGWVQLERSEQ